MALRPGARARNWRGSNDTRLGATCKPRARGATGAAGPRRQARGRQWQDARARACAHAARARPAARTGPIGPSRLGALVACWRALLLPAGADLEAPLRRDNGARAAASRLTGRAAGRWRALACEGQVSSRQAPSVGRTGGAATTRVARSPSPRRARRPPAPSGARVSARQRRLVFRLGSARERRPADNNGPPPPEARRPRATTGPSSGSLRNAKQPIGARPHATPDANRFGRRPRAHLSRGPTLRAHKPWAHAPSQPDQAGARPPPSRLARALLTLSPDRNGQRLGAGLIIRTSWSRSRAAVAGQ